MAVVPVTVTLDRSTPVTEATRAILESRGLEVEHESTLFRTISGRVQESKIQELEEVPGVRAVERAEDMKAI